jgi:hypothetical protein
VLIGAENIAIFTDFVDGCRKLCPFFLHDPDTDIFLLNFGLKSSIA